MNHATTTATPRSAIAITPARHGRGNAVRRAPITRSGMRRGSTSSRPSLPAGLNASALTDRNAVASLQDWRAVMSGFRSLTSVLATAEPMLIAVIGLLVLVIFGLLGMAFVVRRRSRV